VVVKLSGRSINKSPEGIATVVLPALHHTTTSDIVRRQQHRAGEKCRGHAVNIPLIHQQTGEIVPLSVRAVSGASNTPCRSDPDRDLPTGWLHVRAFEFWSVPEIVVPDN